MRQHVRRHTGGLKCKKCTKRFPSMSSLLAHERLHVTDRPEFACEICEAVYKTKGALRIHVVGKHGGICMPAVRRSV